MKLFVFATFEEAKASITHFKARPHQDYYLVGDDIILISGIGPFAAYTSCIPFIEQATVVYNLGIAGALKPSFAAGSCHLIGKCSKFVWHPKHPKTTTSLPLQTSGPHLCTLDFPLHDTPIKELLKQSYDLVDMEGYAIALLAKTHGKKCCLIKVVSDFCDKESPAQIQKELGNYSKTLKESIMQQL